MNTETPYPGYVSRYLDHAKCFSCNEAFVVDVFNAPPEQGNADGLYLDRKGELRHVCIEDDDYPEDAVFGAIERPWDPTETGTAWVAMWGRRAAQVDVGKRRKDGKVRIVLPGFSSGSIARVEDLFPSEIAVLQVLRDRARERMQRAEAEVQELQGQIEALREGNEQ